MKLISRPARRFDHATPLIPHSDLDPDCCGFLLEIMEDDGLHFRCNECGAVLTKENVAMFILTLDSCKATCPQCGKVNHIEGFAEVFAFRCQFCGEGVGL